MQGWDWKSYIETHSCDEGGHGGDDQGEERDDHPGPDEEECHAPQGGVLLPSPLHLLLP